MLRKHAKRLIKDKVLDERFSSMIVELDDTGAVDLRDPIFVWLFVKEFLIEKCRECKKDFVI